MNGTRWIKTVVFGSAIVIATSLPSILGQGGAPAPGGPFALAGWTDTEWGPVLVDSCGWIGARLRPDADHAGWSLLLRAVVERVEMPADPADDLLCYVRGRYRSLTL